MRGLRRTFEVSLPEQPVVVTRDISGMEPAGAVIGVTKVQTRFWLGVGATDCRPARIAGAAPSAS